MTGIRALLVPSGRLSRWLWLTTALAWAALIWWVSAVPFAQLPDVPVPGFIRNGAHVGLFAVLSALVFLAWPDPLERRLPWSAGLATAFGVIEEIHQAWVPGRASSFADMLSNGLGALLGGCVLLWVLGGDHRAARAVPWVVILAMGSVSLATFAGW